MPSVTRHAFLMASTSLILNMFINFIIIVNGYFCIMWEMETNKIELNWMYSGIVMSLRKSRSHKRNESLLFSPMNNRSRSCERNFCKLTIILVHTTWTKLIQIKYHLNEFQSSTKIQTKQILMILSGFIYFDWPSCPSRFNQNMPSKDKGLFSTWYLGWFDERNTYLRTLW